MAAARYWRLCQAVAYAGGDLAVSECALSDAGGRVDGAALITSTVAPTAGSLAALNDGSYAAAVQWAAGAVALPGWAIVWDLGAAYDLVTVGVAAPAQETFLLRFVVQSSPDGVAWSDWGRPAQYTAFPGPEACYVISAGSGTPGGAAPLLTRLGSPAPSLDREDGGNHQIANTISRLGVPGRYRVRLFDRRSGRCVRETWSAADGTYSFPGIAHRPAGYFVVGYDHSGTPVNASISDLLTPEPMP